MKKTKIDHYTDKEALDFHTKNKPITSKVKILFANFCDVFLLPNNDE